MHRIELFLRTLDEINANPNLLPNVKLGCDIRDSCWYPPVALEQSIDFIKNSIASIEQAAAAHHQMSSGGGGAANAAAGTRPVSGGIGAGSGGWSQGVNSSSCVQRKDKPIAGLIGPASSSVTIQV